MNPIDKWIELHTPKKEIAVYAIVVCRRDNPDHCYSPTPKTWYDSPKKAVAALHTSNSYLRPEDLTTFICMKLQDNVITIDSTVDVLNHWIQLRSK